MSQKVLLVILVTMLLVTSCSDKSNIVKDYNTRVSYISNILDYNQGLNGGYSFLAEEVGQVSLHSTYYAKEILSLLDIEHEIKDISDFRIEQMKLEDIYYLSQIYEGFTKREVIKVEKRLHDFQDANGYFYFNTGAKENTSEYSWILSTYMTNKIASKLGIDIDMEKGNDELFSIIQEYDSKNEYDNTFYGVLIMAISILDTQNIVLDIYNPIMERAFTDYCNGLIKQYTDGEEVFFGDVDKYIKYLEILTNISRNNKVESYFETFLNSRKTDVDGFSFNNSESMNITSTYIGLKYLIATKGYETEMLADYLYRYQLSSGCFIDISPIESDIDNTYYAICLRKKIGLDYNIKLIHNYMHGVEKNIISKDFLSQLNFMLLAKETYYEVSTDVKTIIYGNINGFLDSEIIIDSMHIKALTLKCLLIINIDNLNVDVKESVARRLIEDERVEKIDRQLLHCYDLQIKKLLGLNIDKTELQELFELSESINELDESQLIYIYKVVNVLQILDLDISQSVQEKWKAILEKCLTSNGLYFMGTNENDQVSIISSFIGYYIENYLAN